MKTETTNITNESPQCKNQNYVTFTFDNLSGLLSYGLVYDYISMDEKFTKSAWRTFKNVLRDHNISTIPEFFLSRDVFCHWKGVGKKTAHIYDKLYAYLYEHIWETQDLIIAFPRVHPFRYAYTFVGCVPPKKLNFAIALGFADEDNAKDVVGAFVENTSHIEYTDNYLICGMDAALNGGSIDHAISILESIQVARCDAIFVAEWLLKIKYIDHLVELLSVMGYPVIIISNRAEMK